MKTLTSTILALAMAGYAVTGLPAADTGTAASLYQRLGGMPAIRAVVDDFTARIFSDARVQPFFGHMASNPDHAKAYQSQLADLVCQVTGGPCKYSGADMATTHQGRGISEADFSAVVSDLVATLDKLQVPAKEKNDLLALLAPLKPMIVEQKK